MAIEEPRKYLFLTSNGTYGHIVPTMKVAKRLSKQENTETYIACDGKAAQKARDEGFAVLQHPMVRAFSEDYIGGYTNFKGYITDFLNDLVNRINPDAVIMNFAYSFKPTFDRNIPSFLLFPEDLKDRIRYYSDIVDEIFLTFPEEFWNPRKEFENVEPVGPVPHKRDFKDKELKKVRSNYNEENLVLMSFGAGEWKKENLKKIVDSAEDYFRDKEDFHILITGDFNPDIENSTILGDLPPVEYLKTVQACDYAVFHGGQSTFEASILGTPFLSFPMPDSREQKTRVRKLEKFGCTYSTTADELDPETFREKFEKLEEKKEEILENQKKIFGKYNSLETIEKRIEDKTNGKKAKLDIEAEEKFVRNSRNSFLAGFEYKGEKCMFAVNNELSEDFHSIIPEWVRKMLPYPIQKKYSLRPRESEKFHDRVDKIEPSSTRELNGHKVREHIFKFNEIEWTAARWKYNTGKEIFLFSPSKHIEELIENVEYNGQREKNV
ncbi:MAG: hypothetical protein MUP58_03025 [Candidatus Nanohaloarchaeota archaeon QJJ-9]|nr:hypothetical protein [Candidatus Nanohaloarchaeota archaeon QJJ-9]